MFVKIVVANLSDINMIKALLVEIKKQIAKKTLRLYSVISKYLLSLALLV